MMVIGVTGGMASGKSTIAGMIAGSGIRHVDADKLVHRLMDSDIVTIDLLAKAFPDSLTSEGKIDRAILARIISTHPETLATLEAILHSLETMTHEVVIDPVIAARAKAPIDRMLAVKL